ncbi:hypothetical protein GWN15_10685 [candidate division KSB1 bacterium]|nr:hypothetical protein [candidate division KSB1 bacterium]NIS24334.1 hypothetical protein [candidate division KSB1 bacterium]NIU90701.1 hypothetical protein [candidate division KSB1 bacterium]NIW69361.1 hypothetical protein [candidate division KSB1 bacterium]
MVADSETLGPLLDLLRDLMDWFQTHQVNGVVVGGIAVSLLGRPRVTQDVDALVQLEEVNWQDFLSQGKEYNFYPRISEPLTFARKSRVLLLSHQPSGVDLDITFTTLPFEEEIVSNPSTFKISGVRLQLPRPEDLIIMKAIAARPKDLIDIESLIDANPNLEIERVKRIVHEFSEALDMPDLFDNLQKLLTKKRKK